LLRCEADLELFPRDLPLLDQTEQVGLRDEEQGSLDGGERSAADFAMTSGQSAIPSDILR